MINVTLAINRRGVGSVTQCCREAFPNELLSRADITRRFAPAGMHQALRCEKLATYLSITLIR